jgi:hypothetical protein
MMPTLGTQPEVDVLMLCRPGTQPPSNVLAAIEGQRGVQVRLHIEAGCAKPSDQVHWETIARARDIIKRRGHAPWAMFVDDDVLLHKDCIEVLLNALKHSPTLGAIAADSEGDQVRHHWSGHVGMAACLFRRPVLEAVQFRSDRETCECACCATDLRTSGWGITYCSAAKAVHLRNSGSAPNMDPGVVLAAFDRRDIQRFREQFLWSLRRADNEGCATSRQWSNGACPPDARFF